MRFQLPSGILVRAPWGQGASSAAPVRDRPVAANARSLAIHPIRNRQPWWIKSIQGRGRNPVAEACDSLAAIAAPGTALHDGAAMIALSILSVFAVLAAHWLGIYLIGRAFEATLARLGPRGRWGGELAFALAIFGLVLLNLSDITLCALLVGAQDAGLAFSDAFQFAIANFTTVGLDKPAGAAVPPLAGPLIAMCGIVSFGWSTSFLVSCSHAARLHRDGPRPPA